MSASEEWTKEVELRDGTPILLRPEVEDDLEMLWKMFSSLSVESLRFIPNPFTRELVEGWIKNLDYEMVLPIVALSEGPPRRIVASATLMFHPSEAFRHKAEFGIAVHDDYQGRGLGTILTQHMIEIARSRGIKKVTLSVVTVNRRAVDLYRRLGFSIEGKLEREHFNYVTGEYGADYRMALFL
jgi:ribosomal protein S18 acetylase RimI-like enzyme